MKIAIKKYSLPILSGVIIGTSYIPFPPWGILFCYAPLWYFIVNKTTSTKYSFLAGWITQFVLSIIGFHWIAYTAHEFAFLPWVVSIPILLLFASLMHIHIPLSCVAFTYLDKKIQLSNWNKYLLLALFQSIMDLIWPSIFPWHIGYTLLYSELPIYHFADAIGFWGLSTILLLGNAWMAYLIHLNADEVINTKKFISYLVAFGIIFASFNFLGYFHGKKWNHTDSYLNALIVQPNVGNFEKVYAERGQGFQSYIINQLIETTQNAVRQKPETEVVIWPETAVPINLDTQYVNTEYYQSLQNGIKSFGKKVLTGAYSKNNFSTNGRYPTYNGIFLLSEQGIPMTSPYRKNKLLAFGEYFPFGDTFPILYKIFPFVSSFGRGDTQSTMNMENNNSQVRWGLQICYEGLYSDLSRKFSELGAQLFVNVTNDSWFGSYFEPKQHMYMTFARAIENRRPLIRSTNTGISSVITANGDILTQSPAHELWAGFYKIPYSSNPELTIFVKFGHYIWIIVCLIASLIVIFGYKHAKSRKS